METRRWRAFQLSSCMLMNFVTHTWVTCHTSEWFICQKYEWVMAHMKETCHIWRSHVTYKGVISQRRWRAFQTWCLDVKLFVNGSRRTHMSHVSHIWIIHMSHNLNESRVKRMNAPWHIWWSHVTYNKSHVTCKGVMSQHKSSPHVETKALHMCCDMTPLQSCNKIKALHMRRALQSCHKTKALQMWRASHVLWHDSFTVMSQDKSSPDVESFTCVVTWLLYSHVTRQKLSRCGELFNDQVRREWIVSHMNESHDTHLNESHVTQHRWRAFQRWSCTWRNHITHEWVSWHTSV